MVLFLSAMLHVCTVVPGTPYMQLISWLELMVIVFNKCLIVIKYVIIFSVSVLLGVFDFL